MYPIRSFAAHAVSSFATAPLSGHHYVQELIDLMVDVAGGARRAPTWDEATFPVERDMVFAALLRPMEASARFAGVPAAVALTHPRAYHGPQRVHFLPPRILQIIRPTLFCAHVFLRPSILLVRHPPAWGEAAASAIFPLLGS